MELEKAIRCIVDIKTTSVNEQDPLRNHVEPLTTLLGIHGFGLPTASAVLHFCHPARSPIVDIKVEAACAILKSRYATEFESAAPKLPRTSSPRNSIAKYRKFIGFIDTIRALQRQYSQADYRYIDTALMVLGDKTLRAKAESI
jgi:hypothetical protein